MPDEILSCQFCRVASVSSSCRSGASGGPGDTLIQSVAALFFFLHILAPFANPMLNAVKFWSIDWSEVREVGLGVSSSFYDTFLHQCGLQQIKKWVENEYAT